MRKTKQKELIKQALYELQEEHPTAEELYVHLHDDNPKLSLATVYRNLSSFVERGKIKKIDIPGEPTRYDVDTERRVHAFNEETNEIVHLDDIEFNDILRSVERRILSQTHYQVLDFELRILVRPDDNQLIS